MAWKVWLNNSAPGRGATAQRAHFMNISINITYTSGTKVELVVPLEEPAQLISKSESPVTPEPVQPAQDLADAMCIVTNKELESSGKRYTSVNELIDDLCKDPEVGRTMSMYNMTYTTIDGKEWQVPPGLMKDLVIIYGEKTVEQELLKAHAWLEADPQRRKTPRGMGRFLNGWLSRASSMVRTPIKTLLKRDSLMSTNGSTQESW
jgi:hypothetical protein